MTTGNQLIARFEKFANPQLAEKWYHMSGQSMAISLMTNCWKTNQRLTNQYLNTGTNMVDSRMSI